MKTRTKLYYLLNRIAGAKEITPKKGPTYLDPTDLLAKYSQLDLTQLLRKLEEDEKVLRVLQKPTIHEVMLQINPFSYSEEEAYYHLEVLPSFDNYFEKITQEPEYQKFMGIKPAIEAISIEEYEKIKKEWERKEQVLKEGDEPSSISEPILRVDYSKDSREIVINGLFRIARLDWGSENEIVFGYLYENPNKEVSLRELKDEVEREKGEMRKDLHKIVENLGFKAELKRAFFNVSKNGIFFRNPVSKDILNKLGIARITLVK